MTKSGVTSDFWYLQSETPYNSLTSENMYFLHKDPSENAWYYPNKIRKKSFLKCIYFCKYKPQDFYQPNAEGEDKLCTTTDLGRPKPEPGIVSTTQNILHCKPTHLPSECQCLVESFPSLYLSFPSVSHRHLTEKLLLQVQLPFAKEIKLYRI